MTHQNKRNYYLRFPVGSIVAKVSLILVILSSCPQYIFSQIDLSTVISGIINTYTKVKYIGASGTYSIKVASTNGFHVGDAAMIVQMKVPSNIGFSTIVGSDGETHNNDLVSCGRYEILKVGQILSDSVIVFTTQLIGDFSTLYNTTGFVQLIKVPIYKSVTVDSAGLTCLPWDKSRGTGGILAFFAIDQLTLRGDIDVSGQGFHGADPGTENYTDPCSSDLPSILNINYPGSSYIAGYKGEGVYFDDTSKLKGRGKLLTAGGGGNGRFSGGGGGGSYNPGGNGGDEVCSSTAQYAIGGAGGQDWAIPVLNNYIFFGGGGGSGTQLWPSVKASKGGNGGGVVLIISPKIISENGKGIYAKGMDADTTAIGGAGGGGGAGMVLLDAEKCSGSIKIDVTGGRGGYTNRTIIGPDTIRGGPGGGGGSGMIWYRSKLTCFNIKDNTGGDKGLNLPDRDALGAGTGTFGFDYNNVFIQNTGFLFNFLPTDDTVCKASLPKKIIGSVPRGGDGNYDYSWRVSQDKVSWFDAPDINSLKDYQPRVVDTSLSILYYERTVRSGYNVFSNTYSFNDYSAPYTIHLYPAITNNVIHSPDTTLCSGTTPHTMTGNIPAGGAGGYIYSWELSSSLTDWSKADTLSNLQNFVPTKILTANTNDSLYFFRRSVTSGGCTNSENSVILKILPSIKGNYIIPNQILCQNIIPVLLHSDSSLTGGDKNYRKLWENSQNGVNWSTTDTSLNYASPGLSKTTYFRRSVKSGPGDVCQNTSNIDTLLIRPSLSNNILVSGDTAICAGFAPYPFRGLKPSGGDTALHYYLYTWLISEDNSHWVQIYQSHGDTTGYSAGFLNVTSWFRRKVSSGIEGACLDSNNLIKVTVHPRIVNNFVASLDSICKGQVPSKPFTTNDSIPAGGNGSYQYTWQQSFNNVKWDTIYNRPSIYNNLTPDTLYFDRFYRRLVHSGACFDTTHNSLFIKVLQPIGNNNALLKDTIICTGTSPESIHVLGSPTGGNGIYIYSWQLGLDSTLLNLVTGQTDSAFSPANLDTTTFIRRKIISGPCQSISNAVTIKIHRTPVGYLTGPLISSICDSAKLRNLNVRMTNGKVPWDVYLTDSFSLHNIYSNDTTFEKAFTQANQQKQTFTFTIDSLKDANKCPALFKYGQVITTVYYRPVSSSVHLKDTACGNQFTLKGTKPDYAIGTWSVETPNVNFSEPHNPDAVISNNRLSDLVQLDPVRVTWNVYNWDSTCNVNLYDTIIFYRKPVARIKDPSFKNWLGRKDTTIFNHDECALVADTIMYPNSGKWSFTSEGTPVQFSTDSSPTTQIHGLLTNNTPGRWTVIWTVQNPGCPSVTDTTYLSSSIVHPYKGFSPGYGLKTPDGKPLDEVYWIEGIEYESDFTLTILSGWNNMVYFYHGSGQQWTGWDGKGNQFDNNGREMPEGTYYYIFEVKNQKYTGTILLRRKK